MTIFEIILALKKQKEKMDYKIKKEGKKENLEENKAKNPKLYLLGISLGNSLSFFSSLLPDGFGQIVLFIFKTISFKSLFSFFLFFSFQNTVRAQISLE